MKTVFLFHTYKDDLDIAHNYQHGAERNQSRKLNNQAFVE